jgi:hypothetical protein
MISLQAESAENCDDEKDVETMYLERYEGLKGS